jgi:hypothetical protein
MPSYQLFTCPGCEGHFHVIFPVPLPRDFGKFTKIKIKCLGCGEVNEPYPFLLATIMCAPEPGIPTVQVESISPRDPNPNQNAAIEWHQQIFIRRAARFKAMYGN